MVVGLPVSLYRDGNGNGTFDGAGTDTQVGSTINTDASGDYRFTGLTEGTYFVQITPTSGQQVLAGGDLQTVAFNATEAMGITALTIDDFNTAATVTASRNISSVGTTANSVADVPNALSGGVRDLYAEATSLGNVSLTSQFAGGSVLSIESSSGTEGIARVTWDGTDGDGDAVAPGNLNLDFSNGGVNSGMVIRVSADAKPGATVTLRLTSGAGNVSEATVAIVDQDGMFDGDTDEEITVPFSSFITTAGTGVDFDSVTAIEMELDFRSPTINGLDAKIELVGVVGNTVKTADFSVLNRMSLGDLVFADINNNGLFDSGESGIANVDLTLYADTNGSGDYTDGVDQVMGTTTTDASGLYLFEDLLPGDYLVQVNPTEFQSGQPLEGLVTSTGNDVSGMAPDPDAPADGAVDLNSDDNGTAIASFGVLSKAVTLLGDGEPTNDGDSDNNTNLAVDFGFFGFDLTIDKQVDSTTIAPGGQLTYTIVVTNNGPSIASTVAFTDTLPSGVTFSSGSKNVGDGTVQHSSGTVTASLGDIAPNATATITLIVDVDSSTTGNLSNTASVSAPNESDTSNNSALVGTTVSPEIDLELVKTDDDSDQSLAPGSTVIYTINVTNNGPSDATGVTVTDTLPSNVTFNAGASTPAPTTNVGGVLTYDLGTLAANGTSVITVNVTVDSNFVGNITNSAEVAANETETVTTNNNDTAQSVVAVDPSSLSGRVYVDLNNNGLFDPGETPLSGVTLTLTGTDFMSAAVNQTLLTQADGTYQFTNLLPGTYRVQETHPAFFEDGIDSIGSAGGSTSNDDFDQISLASGVNATDYNFGELPPTLSKRRFLASS